MTQCVTHIARWIEQAECWECERCLAVLPMPTGICRDCRRPLDDHDFYAHTEDGTATTTPLLEIPMCRRMK